MRDEVGNDKVPSSKENLLIWISNISRMGKIFQNCKKTSYTIFCDLLRKLYQNSFIDSKVENFIASKWNEINLKKKKATKQILILRYTVSRLKKYFVSRLGKYFVFLPSSDINMNFLIYKRQCIKQGSSLQDKTRLDNTKFLLTQKIKNKGSSNKG